MKSVFGRTSVQHEGDEGNRRTRPVWLHRGHMPVTMWRNAERGNRFEVVKLVEVVIAINAEKPVEGTKDANTVT